jgi:hypothetical protein
MGLQDFESFLPADPRLDHDCLRARVKCDTMCPMPPLQALGTSVRILMNNWSHRKDDWQVSVILSLNLSAPQADPFLELDQAKRIALDCARKVLGISGGGLSLIIQHHSKEAKQLKAFLTLLRVVRREIHARKEMGAIGWRLTIQGHAQSSACIFKLAGKKIAHLKTGSQQELLFCL